MLCQYLGRQRRKFLSQLSSGFAFINRKSFPSQHGASVEAAVHLHQADAGGLVAGQ